MDREHEIHHDAEPAPLPPGAAPWDAARVLTPFQRDVVDLVGSLRRGELLTYGEVAAEVGRPGAAQAVANVLRSVPDLPWWRVVPSGGRLYRTHREFQAPLLRDEGHAVDPDGRITTAAPPGADLRG